MIRNVVINNYKCIQNLEIEFKKLTVLIGPNASGKSSILDFIDSFAQASRFRPSQNYSTDFFLNDTYPFFNEIVYRKSPNLPISFNIELAISSDVDKELQEQIKKGLPSNNKHLKETIPFPYLSYQLKFHQNNVLYHGLSHETTIIGKKFYYEPSNGGYSIQTEIIPDTLSRLTRNIQGDNLFFHNSRSFQQEKEDDKYIVNQVIACINAFQNQIMKIFVLSEIRERIPWRRQLSGIHPDSVGSRGEHTLDILTYITNKKEFKEVSNKISQWVSHFDYSEIAPYIMSVENEPHTSTDVMDEEMGIPVNVAATGFGFQQILPIIVQCFYTPQGGTFIVEEPEIHLHPANQMKMIDLFIDTVKFGNQVIFTTHSEHLFLRLQRRVAEGGIKPSDVAIYYLKKTPEGTQVKPVPLKDDGSIPGWLPSFTEASEDETKELLKLRKKG